MNKKTINHSVQAAIAVGIVILLLIPVSKHVSATDTTPPVIFDIMFDPAIYVGPLADSFICVDCRVDDDVEVAHVRLVISGPNGYFRNASMPYQGWDLYESYVFPLPSYGVYASHIWAVDTSGNQAISDVFYSLIFENTMPYVHVQAGSPFPWDGTPAHPFPGIGMGLAIVSPGGTIFVHNGLYPERIYPGSVNIVGESKENVILQSYGYSEAVRLFSGILLNISNMTIANSQYGFLTGEAGDPAHVTIRNCNIRNNSDGFFVWGSDYITITNCNICNNGNGCNFGYGGSISNELITNCNIYNNGIGIAFSGNQANNQIYHNNFINNTQHVSIPYGGTSTWDDGTTGNYWDTYRTLYPNAHVVPATGTWDTPYQINTNNFDHHPWVYPNGHIDTVPPMVTVIYPNGGETVSGSITIQWTASDDYTPSLNHKINISYSANNGSTWQIIASGVNNTGTYTWNTTTVPNGNEYLIRVDATDEFLNTGSDTSNGVFTILNNQPPNPPQKPNGPANGYNNISYTYTTNTTDPDGNQVYYQWNWGDGDVSNWMGPYASGATVSAAHTWIAVGNYKMKVKAKDDQNATSDWSPALPVNITAQPEEPVLNIESIKGGFGITAVINNTGNANATNVAWTIHVTGGIFGRINITKSGTIATLVPQHETINKTGIFFGLGKLNITVSVNCDEVPTPVVKNVPGKILLFWVKV